VSNHAGLAANLQLDNVRSAWVSGWRMQHAHTTAFPSVYAAHTGASDLSRKLTETLEPWGPRLADLSRVRGGRGLLSRSPTGNRTGEEDERGFILSN
jgi:hypothetical protein